MTPSARCYLHRNVSQSECGVTSLCKFYTVSFSLLEILRENPVVLWRKDRQSLAWQVLTKGTA